MRRGAWSRCGVLLAVACLFLALPAVAATIFQEDFESPAGLNNGQWTRTNGQIISPGNNSAHALSWTAVKDSVVSVVITSGVVGLKKYYVIVDYKETGAGGQVELLEMNNGGHTLGGWLLFGDSTTTAMQVFRAPGSGYHRYVQSIVTPANARKLQIVLKDDPANSTPPGHVFFDNLMITDTPPSTGVTVVQWREVVSK